MKTILINILLFFTAFSFAQSNEPKQPENTKPFVIGVIEEIQSTLLAEKRTINIYLPEGYKQDDTTKYPVIYLLDGSADEDFIHVAGLVQFNSFPWINRVPKSIVVGIANVDRKRDLPIPQQLKRTKKNFPLQGIRINLFHLSKKNYNLLLKKNTKQPTPKPSLENR